MGSSRWCGALDRPLVANPRAGRLFAMSDVGYRTDGAARRIHAYASVDFTLSDETGSPDVMSTLITSMKRNTK
jgi:hypothetical protein